MIKLCCACCGYPMDVADLEMASLKVELVPDAPTDILIGTCHDCENQLEGEDDFAVVVRRFLSNHSVCALADPLYAFGIATPAQVEVAMGFCESADYRGISDGILAASAEYTATLFGELKAGKTFGDAHEAAVQVWGQGADA